jgi:hypothetical protein
VKTFAFGEIAFQKKEKTKKRRTPKHTGHNATVEESRLSLVDEHGSCQGDGNKIDDTAIKRINNS